MLSREQFLDNGQELLRVTLTLGVESTEVSRQAVSRINSTHREDGHARETRADGRNKFESRHTRHVEIGNDEIKPHIFQLAESIPTITRGVNDVSSGAQNHSRGFTYSLFVVDD